MKPINHSPPDAMLERLAVRECRRRLGGSVQRLEQRLGGASRAAFALLPVAGGCQQHLDPLRKLSLAQAQALSDPANEPGRGLLGSNVRFVGCIHPRRVDAPTAS